MTLFIPAGRARLCLFMLLSVAGLSACGNKGPLYIPPPPVEQQTVPAEQQTPEEQGTEES